MREIIDLLVAKDCERTVTHTFHLRGDLRQLSHQKVALKNLFSIEQDNVWPCLKEENVTEALSFIWNNAIDGWWHYEKDMIERNICTDNEFMAKLML